jgi:NADP-dependent 3-hydroxy acid dehydrogenase YdfG
MKIAITGHTKGIGKACADLLGQEHEIVGLSRSNGFSIEQTNMCAMKIVPCDVFINNAYLSTYQSKLFEIIFKQWMDKPKTIINLGSRARYEHNFSGSIYSSDKRHLEHSVEHMTFGQRGGFNKQCRVMNLNPGYVDTEMAALDIEDGAKPPAREMMTPEHMAMLVKWMLDTPHKFEVYDLSIWNTTYNQ